MVTINLNYLDGLRCEAVHQPSGDQLKTDAPIDNNGKGEAFSPTDLVATAVGACMATVMGIVAERKGLSLAGMKIQVRKHMTSSGPRRIEKIELDLEIPLPSDHSDRKILENAALGCPVHQSLHPDIQVVCDWTWL